VTLESVAIDIWRDPAVPTVTRVRNLMDQMTVPEKIAQLSSIGLGIDSAGD